MPTPTAAALCSALCLAVACAAACSSDDAGERKDNKPASAASPVANATVHIDAQASSDAGEASAAHGDSAQGAHPTGRPHKPDVTVVFNQVIVRVRDGAELGDDELRRRAETATGAEVVTLRKGPIGTRLLVFAPAEPPRDKPAQDALAGALQRDIPELKYAEGQRLFQPRTKASSPPTAEPSTDAGVLSHP